MRKARSAQRSSEHCQEPEVRQGRDLTSKWLNTFPRPAGSQANPPPWLGFLPKPGPSRALVHPSVHPSPAPHAGEFRLSPLSHFIFQGFCWVHSGGTHIS